MIETNLHNDSTFLINNNSINDLASLVLNEHGYKEAVINIIVTDDNSLRELKNEYFNENIFTDVIAFNIEQEPFEGEVYISYHRVEENAKIYKQTLQDEFKRVVIHGILHLCGYEDSTSLEKKNMSLAEDKFLAMFSEGVIDK